MARRDGKPEPCTRSIDRLALSKRLHIEFIAGAEEDSRRRLGRGLTAEELERVLRHFPGD
jgi:hypothetical protein